VTAIAADNAAENEIIDFFGIIFFFVGLILLKALLLYFINMNR
jgi:hypothetical protein